MVILAIGSKPNVELAKNAGFKKMAVISGIGVREYYRRLGYFRPPNSPYMTKYLA